MTTNTGVVLIRPKYAHNVGAAIRNAAALGIENVYWTDDRFNLAEMGRIPREERYREYQDAVHAERDDRPFDRFDSGVTPVCVELVETAELLHEFEHPERAVYVFGPEDGSVPKAIRVLCHRFVAIPSLHCLNLSVAMGTVLAHRRMQMIQRGLVPRMGSADMLAEDRGVRPSLPHMTEMDNLDVDLARL